MLIRRIIADVDSDRVIVNDSLGALKRMNAEEPFFAMVDGSLLEGRVNIVDLSNVRIPKQYLDIFPRFRDSASGLYSDEVIRTGSQMIDRFIAGTGGVFPRLSNVQSVALSAALEYLACDRVGATVRDDALSRYGVTRRRLINAIDRLVKGLILGSDSTNSTDGGET